MSSVAGIDKIMGQTHAESNPGKTASSLDLARTISRDLEFLIDPSADQLSRFQSNAFAFG
jgi:hypothetical protein